MKKLLTGFRLVFSPSFRLEKVERISDAENRSVGALTAPTVRKFRFVGTKVLPPETVPLVPFHSHRAYMTAA